MEKKRSTRKILFLLMTVLLAVAPVAPATAEGCSENLAKEFLKGWSNDMSRLLSTFTDDIV
jgi:hypothetical protein